VLNHCRWHKLKLWYFLIMHASTVFPYKFSLLTFCNHNRCKIHQDWMWGQMEITSSWWFLYNKPHDHHLRHPQPYTSITISSTVHDGSRTANTREWMMMIMMMMKKQLKAWSNVKSSCIFLKNKLSISNWYVLGIWAPVF